MPAPTSYWHAAHSAAVPMLAWCAWLGIAGTACGQRFGAGEAAWVAPTGQRPWNAILHAWVAALLASAVFLLGLTAIVLALPGDAVPDWKVGHVIELEAAPAIRPTQELIGPPLRPARVATLLQKEWSPEHRIALWVYATGLGGPTTRAELKMTFEDSEGESGQTTSDKTRSGEVTKEGEAGQIIDGFRWLRTQGSAPQAPQGWRLRNTGSGELGVLAGRGLSVLQPTSALPFCANLGLRAWILCGCFAALGLAFGAWLRPALGRALFAGFALAWWAWGPWPWLNLPADWHQWAHAVGPSPWPWSALLAASATALVALVSATFGLRSWGLNR